MGRSWRNKCWFRFWPVGNTDHVVKKGDNSKHKQYCVRGYVMGLFIVLAADVTQNYIASVNGAITQST